MFEWHRKVLNQMMKHLNLDAYQVLTIVFYEFFIR